MTDFSTWHAARDKCAEYGADLASIRGEEEADFVKNQVQLCGYDYVPFPEIVLVGFVSKKFPHTGITIGTSFMNNKKSKPAVSRESC